MTVRTGTATVLFTDLVGSTALRAQLGEERADELRRAHDDLLGSCVVADGGTVVKGGGDGILATFDSAAGGVHAAVSMQQAIWRHNLRANRLAELSVRIGISTGDVAWEGGDCFGLPVVEAARLEAAAEGGQVLCSELVRLMTRGRGSHEFRPIGFLDLKGLPEPIAACEVVWAPPDLEAGTGAGRVPLPPELTVDTQQRFVSRAEELQEVSEALSDPSRQRAAVVWLLGEPGIGKTRLAVEAAREAHAGGAMVLFGRCNEDLSVPYQPFLEALRWHIRHLGADEVPAALGPLAGELSRLVPELRELHPSLVCQPSTNVDVEQYRLFEAVRLWLCELSMGGEARPVVFVVDDAHWATPQTIQMLGHIARSAEPSRLCFVCTARTTAPDASPVLADLSTDLQRAAVPTAVVTLDAFDETEVAELVTATAGEALAEVSARLHRETGGNPLFLTTLLGALPVGSAALPEVLPASVQETVRRRMRAVGPETVELLRLAAVVGLDFELAVVAQAQGAHEDNAVDHLEIARSAGLVVETGFGRYRFAHALMRDALRGELSETRRVRSHAAIARAIEARYGSDERVDELAYHYWEARAADLHSEAYSSNVAAGRRATTLLSHRDAATYYRRASELAEPAGRAGLLFAQGLAEHHGGDMLAGFQTLQTAAEVAADHDQSALLADIAVALEDATWQPGLQVAGTVELLQRALAGLDDADHARSIRVKAALGRALAYSGRPDEGRPFRDKAVSEARALGDDHLLGYALIRKAFAWRDLSVEAGLADLVEELDRVAATVVDDELALNARNVQVTWLTRMGRFIELEHLLSRFESDGARLGQPFWLAAPAFYRLGLAFAVGDLAETERRSDSLIGFGEAIQAGDFSGMEGFRTFQLRHAQGRLEEIAPAMRMLLRLSDPASFWQPGLAATFAGLGWLEEARGVLDRFDPQRLPDDDLQELAVCLLLDAVDALGGHRIAPQLYDLLAPWAGLSVFFGHGLLSPGPVDRHLGLAAAAMGDQERAGAHFAAATDLARRMPAAHYVALALADWGRWLCNWGRGAEAAPLLAEASELATSLNLGGLLRRLSASQPSP